MAFLHVGVVARTPQAHRASGIDVRMLSKVEAIDIGPGRWRFRTWPPVAATGKGSTPWSSSPASSQVRPSLPGCDAAGVFGVQTLVKFPLDARTASW
jgi:hypothetical protein